MWTKGLLTYDSAKKFCKCFEAGHKESEFKPITPLSKELQTDIDNLQSKKSDNDGKAIKHYQERLNKERDEDLKFAEEHPREKVGIFDE